MAPEFYPAAETAITKRMYADLKEQAAAGRVGRITILGGWAVYELVDPLHAYESLDIDVLIRDQESWAPAIGFFLDRGFRWRKITERMRDQRLEHPAHENVAVDVFYDRRVNSETLRTMFGTRWVPGFKEMADEGFLPSLRTLVEDKMETLPRRMSPDRKEKQFKDALDLHALLFHNKDRVAAQEILTGASRARASVTVKALERLRAELPDQTVMLEALLAVLGPGAK